MDPVTVAGLVLSIALLIISAVESYEVAFRPFLIYRRYSREIAKFATKLDAQKAIFNNQCQLLLLAPERNGSDDGVILDNILKDSSHPSRTNQSLSKQLEKLLGVSLQTCISTLKLIHQTLEEITKETKGFQELLGKKPGEKHRFIYFKSKIKISFARTRLNEVIDELRLYNEDLRNLANQVLTVSREKKLNQTEAPLLLVDFQTAQQASLKLYGFLVTRWQCNTQVQHAASLSLDVQIAQSKYPLGTRFCLSINCISENPVSEKEAIWLNIESSPSAKENVHKNSASKTSPEISKLAETLANLRLVPDLSESKNHYRAESSTLKIVPIPARPNPASATASAGAEKLCSYFQSHLQHTTPLDNSAVHFEITGKFEHCLYKCPCPLGFKNKTLSLHQILEDDFRVRRREAWASKFELAKSLTLAILRFRSTPWVGETINSGGVHFLVKELQAGNQGYSLEDPFIRIQLSSDINDRLLEGKVKGKGRQLSRNELLHNLGVILLELGYNAPLQYLRSTEDVNDGDNVSWYTDFFTARRLGRSAPRDLDARYGRLAKKCLECDFGVGDDLNSAELQSAVVRDVLNELDKCIKLDRHINSILS